MATSEVTAAERARYRRWATDTWRSLDAMTDPRTGLPADQIDETLAPAARSGYTSPTNIGGYLWSAVVAHELDLIDRAEALGRVGRTLDTLAGIAHHRPSGMLYNWYRESDGAVLIRTVEGDRIWPFCSSVDNGWLGAALRLIASALPESAGRAGALFDRMRWGAFLDPDAGRPGGLVHGGFYDAGPPPQVATFVGDHLVSRERPVHYTTHHYDTVASETRMTSYLGLLTGQYPAAHYFGLWRTFPPDHDPPPAQPPQATRISGHTRRYAGVDVFEGAFDYRGMRIVPGWGGSMFEELMPDLFVPEAAWAGGSWGVNHALHVRGQREHGLVEAGYGYWGFSPSSRPGGGYREYGVDALGMCPDGYTSDAERTRAGSDRDAYGDGVVTPHAAALALAYERDAATENLVRLARELGCYGGGGFFDAVAVRSGTVSRTYLALDQSMIMAALGNLLCDDLLRRSFATSEVESALRPVIGPEVFSTGVML